MVRKHWAWVGKRGRKGSGTSGLTASGLSVLRALPFRSPTPAGRSSVPAGEFGHIDSHPSVVGKVEKLNLAKESCRHWLEREPPRVWVAAEFEAGHKKTKTDAGLGAGDQRKVLDVVGGCAGWDRDPDETLLSSGRDQLASSSGDRALGGGRFPLAGCAEPRDRFFVGWNVGGAGLDVAGVDDRAEFQAGRVVEERGWIGAAGGMIGRRWNGDELDVDVHGCRFLRRVPVAPESVGKKATEEISGREKGSASG